MGDPLRIAVLLSGSGTTLANLLRHIERRELPARIVRVISSKPVVYGLTRAEEAGIETETIERRACSDVSDFSERIFRSCRAAQADLVCMAGFLQLIEVPEDYTHRVMNIHPSLIPSFCGKGFHGKRVHQAVLDHGVKVSGCTVHFADNEYDNGPIILQRAVPVLEDDMAETLAARVFEAECEAYPEAIRLFAENRLRPEGRRVRVLPPLG